MFLSIVCCSFCIVSCFISFLFYDVILDRFFLPSLFSQETLIFFCSLSSIYSMRLHIYLSTWVSKLLYQFYQISFQPWSDHLEQQHATSIVSFQLHRTFYSSYFSFLILLFKDSKDFREPGFSIGSEDTTCTFTRFSFFAGCSRLKEHWDNLFLDVKVIS